jgi:hypothetical protein
MWGRLGDFVKGTQLRTRKKYAYAFSGQNKRAAAHLPFFGGEIKADVLDQQSRTVRQAYREFHRAPALFNTAKFGAQRRDDGYKTLKVSTSRGFTKGEVKGLRAQSNLFQKERDWGFIPDEDDDPLYYESENMLKSMGEGSLKNFCLRLLNNPHSLQPGSQRRWGELPRILGANALGGREENLVGPAVWVDLYNQEGERKFKKGKHT